MKNTLKTLWVLVLALVHGLAVQAQQRYNNLTVLTNLTVGNAITGLTLNGYNIDAITTNSASSKLAITNGTAVNLTGSLTNVTLDGATLAQPFAYNVGRSSGTNAYFNAGNITFRDGQVLSFAGGSVACIASRTNFIGINLFTGDLVPLRAAVDHGTVFIGQVVCSSNAISSVSQGPIVLPPQRVLRFRRAIQHAGHKLKLVTIGNSIMDGAFGAAWDPVEAVFLSTASPATYLLENTSTLKWIRHELSAQKSAEGLMWAAGRSVTTLAAQNTQGASILLGPDYIARNETSGALYTLAPALQGADLAVILDHYNGGDDNWRLLEAMVSALRAQGTEVILCTDNEPRDSDSGIYDVYERWTLIANRYKCALADTRSYLEYRHASGEADLYSDANHPSGTKGVPSHAMVIRSVLHDYLCDDTDSSPVQRKGYVLPIEDPAADYPNGAFFTSVDFVSEPASTTGSWVATGITAERYTKIPTMQLSGRASSAATLELETGEHAFFYHPFAQRMDVILEKSTNSYTIDYRKPNDTSYVSLTPTTDDPHVQSYAMATASAVRADVEPEGYETSAFPWKNFGAKLVCTNGTAKVLGVMFYTWPWREIRRSAISFGGEWHNESNLSGALADAPFTDTIGSSFSFEFEGNACIIPFMVTPAGGRVDVWFDNTQIFTAHDLRSSSGGTLTRQLACFPARTSTWADGAADAGFGRHTVRVKYVSNHASATSVVAGAQRRVQLAGSIVALDLR